MLNLGIMRYLLLPLLTLILFAPSSIGQCKTYRLTSGGDTLDCVDMNGLKQGKWVMKVPPLRGEPGYEEEGEFHNGLREGTWRRFNLMGDPVALENYRWGNKQGICRYYTLSGLEHEESWRAFSPGRAYDTIDVQDLSDPNKYERVVVKTDGRSMRHGIWKYYHPQTGQLIKTEKYVLDVLQEPGTEELGKPLIRKSDTSGTKPPSTPVVAKPKAVLDFEKKTSGKKNKVRDGRTGN